MENNSPMIEVIGLTKNYGSFVALKDINLTVSRGEILGLLGPNGAGKTTLMRILTGFMPGDQGIARVDGLDVASQNELTRAKIGYLPESAPLYEDMTVLDSLYYFAGLKNIPAGQRKKAVAEKANQCSLNGVLEKPVGHLSKGYRQRVGLALALLNDPQVLILDEPTSGLDPNQILEIRDLIRQIGRQRTVLLSTHILSEVQATCDRVVIIDKGRLVISGTPSELTRDSQQGAGKITVGIKGPEEEVKKALLSLDGIHSAYGEPPDDKGIIRYELAVAQDDELAEKIFGLIVEKGWKMNHLAQATATLEDVFIRLTGGENTAKEG